jgi:gliding motility-associated-like protein
MRLQKITVILFFLLIPAKHLFAQSFTFSCTKDTFIARCAGTPCFTLKALIPDIHASTASYTVNPVGATPTACFPVYLLPNDPGGTSANLTIDDQYSTPVSLPFSFPFYGSTYNSLIASPNGVVSFDISKAGQFAHFGILRDVNTLNAASGVPENLPSLLYDAALIMGPYHDLAPQYPTSPNKKVQYQVTGTAPHRRWVFSFFEMPLYLITGGCNLLIENTHQIVLYESTGIIEVLVFGKQVCSGWNDGRSMIGIQNFAKNQALMVNGRRATDAPWGTPGMNEAYRFVPAAGVSLFKRVELYDISGNLLTTGTVANLANGQLEASFPNVCPPVGLTTPYIVRSVYSKFDNPAVEIFGTDTINITKGASVDLNATAVSTNTSCFAPTGTITITVPAASANPPYTYILDGGAPVTGGSPFTFSNVNAGPHTVVVTDVSAVCSSTINLTVERNNEINANLAVTATACTEVGTGTIRVTPTNGTAPYSFQLDGFLPVTGPAPYTFTGVFAGTHNVIVFDATGCQTNVLTVTVPAAPGVAGSTSSTPASCSMVANGSITATATSGIAPFSWQIDGGALTSGPNPHLFTGVSSGAHTITIVDSAGCSRSFSVTVGAGPGVNGIVTFTPASCQAATNATITATGTQGTAPFMFQLDGGAFQSGGNPFTFSNLPGGPHFVTIRDNIGCTRSFNINVTAGPGPSASAVSTPTSCNGASNGTITVTGSGGAPPYSFSLDGAAPVPGTSPYTFTNIAAGIHTVSVTDTANCVSNVFPIAVTAGPTITTTVNKTDVLCNGGATGTITVNQPLLGAPPFQYSIGGVLWQNSNFFSGLVAGTYTVFYRSANGCIGSQPVTITEPLQLAATVSTVPVRCNGENNGVINVSASGGTAPYQYSIDGGFTWQPSNIFNVVAGNYTITIRDFNGCIVMESIIVTEPAVLTAFSTNSNASCDGGNDGRIIVSASGGNAGYQYSLDGVLFQNSNTFNVPPGTYTVVVRDNLGCRTSFNTTVGLTINLFLNPLRDTSICEGTSGQLQLVTNATIYNWSPATGLNNSAISNPVANPAATTQYIVHVTLGRCSTSDTMIVNVNRAPIPDAGPDGDICYGQSYTLQGSGGTQFNWSPPAYLNSTFGANPTATPTLTTVYTLSVVDAIGCRSLVTDDVKVLVSKPIRVYTYPFDTIAYPGQPIPLLAASAGITYSWSPALGLSNTNVANPVAVAGNIGDDITYQVVATTAEGCKGEGYVRIKISKGPDIYVPTAFTPNGDGLNDKFTPRPVGIKAFKFFRVFNRWGQLVFSTKTQNEGWDGTIGGKEQPAGIYVWMIEGIAHDNRFFSKKGTTTLIR